MLRQEGSALPCRPHRPGGSGKGRKWKIFDHLPMLGLPDMMGVKTKLILTQQPEPVATVEI